MLCGGGGGGGEKYKEVRDKIVRVVKDGMNDRLSLAASGSVRVVVETLQTHQKWHVHPHCHSGTAFYLNLAIRSPHPVNITTVTYRLSLRSISITILLFISQRIDTLIRQRALRAVCGRTDRPDS
jgi:hypothetical protein